MKPVCFLIVLTTIAYAQQAPPKPSIQAESSGKCSPNILSNQGTVRFTCNAAIDKGTATKIVSLLNQILQKQGKENGASEVDQKLDEILGFLRNDAQAREPRHFTDAQKRTLIAALSSTPNQVVSILRTMRSSELDTFADELVEVVKEAGWRVESDVVALAGFEKGLGLGVVVRSQQEHPAMADILVNTLTNLGFKVEADTNSRVPTNEIRLVIAPKP